MAATLLIESRDPFSDNGVAATFDLAADLRAAGNEVTLFLVENGVLGARNQARLTELAAAGVEVLADDFSLVERGIAKTVSGVRAAPIDIVIDRLAEGRKALWH